MHNGAIGCACEHRPSSCDKPPHRRGRTRINLPVPRTPVLPAVGPLAGVVLGTSLPQETVGSIEPWAWPIVALAAAAMAYDIALRMVAGSSIEVDLPSRAHDHACGETPKGRTPWGPALRSGGSGGI